MPSSPFTQFANATLTFSVSTGVYATNSVGNRVPQMQEQVLTALLQPTKRLSSDEQAEVQRYAGVDGVAIMMSGYLVSPLVLPPAIHAPIEGIAQIAMDIEQSSTGKFMLLPSVQSPYLVALNVDIVSSIRGLLKIR